MIFRYSNFNPWLISDGVVFMKKLFFLPLVLLSVFSSIQAFAIGPRRAHYQQNKLEARTSLSEIEKRCKRSYSFKNDQTDCIKACTQFYGHDLNLKHACFDGQNVYFVREDAQDARAYCETLYPENSLELDACFKGVEREAMVNARKWGTGTAGEREMGNHR